MPNQAKLYIFAIVAAGGLLLASAAALWSCASPIRWIICLVLTALASTFKVRLPGMDGCISPSLVPLLFAAGTLSWQETVLIAGAAGVVQTLWKPSKGWRSVQGIHVAFNAANLALSIFAAYRLAQFVAPGQPAIQLGVEAVVYELLNTLSVSLVIQLVTGGDLSGIWRNCHLWTFPYHLAGALVALVWIQWDLALGASVIVALTLYLMSAFYEEMVRRTGRQGVELTASQ